MIKCFAVFSLATVFISSAQAGEPFKCRITSEDGSLNKTVPSVPMQGHGLQHFASLSFAHQGREYFFDGQATIFSDLVSVRVQSGGFFASAKKELSFGIPSRDTINISCENLK